MSTTVLPQLKTIEAELASQEKQLAVQLASVREKIAGIRTVMPMFDGTAEGSVAKESVTSSDEPSKEKETAAVKAPATKTKTTAKEATAKKATAKKATVKKAAVKKAAPEKTTISKKTTAKKKDGRTASWQKYTRPGVKNESIPDAVKLILETQPENEFKIADVMSALFKEDMPKTQYLKARNRISNVLSGGVRAGDWFKGARGTYRMTAA